MRASTLFYGGVALIVAAGYLLAVESRKPPSPEEAARKAKQDEFCRSAVVCWGDRHLVEATGPCVAALQRLARYDVRWTNDFIEPKLLPARWLAIEQGHVIYRGDKLQMQNGFGAWENVIYECDFDTATKTVLDVRTRPGRL